MRKVTFLLTAILFLSGMINAQNVGIGTITPPLLRLHVSSITDSNLLLLENRNPLGLQQLTSMYFRTGGYYTGAIKTIGASSNEARLGFFTYGASSINGLIERMSILDNGNVGINTTTPTAQMDVNGTLRIRGNGAAAGNVLTSDADGNATWNALTRNEVYSIGSAAFQPEASSYPLIRASGAGGVYFLPAPPSATFILAPVTLPQGASVTQITMYFRDNVAGNLALDFLAEDLTFGSFNILASATTSGASTNWRSIVLTPVAPITINNNTLAYYVKAYGTWTGNFDLAIKGAVIKYSYTINN